MEQIFEDQANIYPEAGIEPLTSQPAARPLPQCHVVKQGSIKTYRSIEYR